MSIRTTTDLSREKKREIMEKLEDLFDSVLVKGGAVDDCVELFELGLEKTAEGQVELFSMGLTWNQVGDRIIVEITRNRDLFCGCEWHHVRRFAEFMIRRFYSMVSHMSGGSSIKRVVEDVNTADFPYLEKFLRVFKGFHVVSAEDFTN
jgi:hypothetical protein